MTNHATVASRKLIWPRGTQIDYLNLESNGKWYGLPACFEAAKAGDVVAVVTPHELALIETYRRHCKPRESQP